MEYICCTAPYFCLTLTIVVKYGETRIPFLPFRYSTSLLGEPGSPSIVVLCGCAFVWTMSKICVKEVC